MDWRLRVPLWQVIYDAVSAAGGEDDAVPHEVFHVSSRHLLREAEVAREGADSQAGVLCHGREHSRGVGPTQPLHRPKNDGPHVSLSS